MMDMRPVRTALLGVLVLAPTLAAQQPAGGTAAPEAAPAPRVRQSWTADRRDFEVGDVITVLVDEYTLASADQRDFATDRRSRDLVLSGGVGATGATADVLTTNDAESRRSGASTRRNRFQGEITARVVSMENGLMRIEGRKLLDVDDSREELTLTGWVRPEDISSANTVDSWRLGDAEIVYASEGDISKPKGGFLSRILGWIWP